MNSEIIKHIQKLNAAFQLVDTQLRIGFKPGVGRGLFTRKRLKRGETILVCPPLAVHDHFIPKTPPKQCLMCYQYESDCPSCSPHTHRKEYLSK